MRWLYEKNITISIEDYDDFEFDAQSKEAIDKMKLWNAEILNLVKLWLLADELIMRPLQNMVTKKLSHYLMGQDSLHEGEYFSTEWLSHVYGEGRTASDSPLRQLAVDFCAYMISSGWMRSHRDHFPFELLMELSVQSVFDETEDELRYVHIRQERDYLVTEGT